MDYGRLILLFHYIISAHWTDFFFYFRQIEQISRVGKMLADEYGTANNIKVCCSTIISILELCGCSLFFVLATAVPLPPQSCSLVSIGYLYWGRSLPRNKYVSCMLDGGEGDGVMPTSVYTPYKVYLFYYLLQLSLPQFTTLLRLKFSKLLFAFAASSAVVVVAG